MATSSETPITSATPTAKYGESLSYDPEFHGPVKSRSCTDVICLFLFVSFIAGWLVVGFFAFREGDPRVLVYPTDTEGNICGFGHLEKKPYLFFFDLLTCANAKVMVQGCPTPQVCVSHCPNETFIATASSESPEVIKKKLICKYGTDTSAKTVDQLISNGDCAKVYLKSNPIFGRCIPDVFLSEAGKFIKNEKNETVTDNGREISVETVKNATRFLANFLSVKEIGEKVFSDFKTSWHLILIGLLASMVIALIWIVLMRWVAGCMVWLSILIVLSFSAFACYYSVDKYIQLQKTPGAAAKFGFTTNLKSYLALKDTWLAFAIITGSLFAILALVLIFLRKRIVLAILLIKEASRAVGCMFTALVFPIFPYLLMLIFFVFWAVVALYIASSGKASFIVADAPPGSEHKNGSYCNPKHFNKSGEETVKCLFQTYGLQGNLYTAHIYNLFGLFWGLFFAVGIGQLSLSGAFAVYYWTLNKSDIPTFAVGLGFWRCFRYHLGSVAFGSILLAVVRTIRVILEYIDQKCKKYDNAFTKAILCCMKCCFWCLENFLKFLSKNAYIMVAIYGKNFCTSARRAFMLLMRNILRVVVLDKVTDFLLFLGKLVVVSFAAGLSFYFFASGQTIYQGIPSLNFNLLPPIFITLGAYIIASGFFNVYEMAVDTLFLCFLEDCERNDGSPERPYYMSKQLMKILAKQNKLREPAT